MNKNASQIKRELYLYVTPNNEGLKKKDCKRRAVIAGMYVGDELRIAKSTCSLKDQFIRVKGRGIAKSRALSDNPILIQGVTNPEEIGRLFTNLAKTL